MLRTIKLASFTAAVALLAGCAASVMQTPTSATAPSAAPRAQAPSGALVAVVSGSTAMQTSSDWPAFVEEWQTSMANSASGSKMAFVLAKDEATVPANGAVLVRLTVNDFKYVSTTKRYLLGIMAGNAYMDVDAEYLELPSKKPFGAKKFNTSSSAWQGIFSAVTPKQVQAVSDVIVKEVVSTAPAK
ncbi:hypothetical protein [Ideonella sp.]|uniref:hypothetical protein n=1 Tax=Ideonella sp. TaxID=1929293 RepID=UPI002B486A67|nr:hypothetical protein [Ideonella sp.]HJV67698.1 hypothetical protein [Ideonella sp.]